MGLHRANGNEHKGEEVVVGLVRKVKARVGEMTQLVKARLTTNT